MITFSQVICLSLPKRQDRRDALLANLANCNWPFPQPIFHDGIDGWKLPSSEWEHICRACADYSPGCHGANMGHAQICAIAEQSEQPTLILEDDVEFNPDFGEKATE